MNLELFSFLCILLGCERALAISGGSPADIHNHPYQAAIDLSEFGDFKQACTGALVGSRTVVTSGSCVTRDTNSSAVRVRLGSQIREDGGEIFSVAGNASHPTLDIVLLYLDAVADPRPTVQRAPLASQPVKEGDVLIISGYGDQSESGKQDPRLYSAAVRSFNLEQCETIFYFSSKGHACAGGWRTSMCGKRDIGAPLVNWLGELVGIALSSNLRCGVPGYPTVYEDLTTEAAKKWITDNMDKI